MQEYLVQGIAWAAELGFVLVRQVSKTATTFTGLFVRNGREYAIQITSDGIFLCNDPRDGARGSARSSLPCVLAPPTAATHGRT